MPTCIRWSRTASNPTASAIKEPHESGIDVNVPGFQGFKSSRAAIEKELNAVSAQPPRLPIRVLRSNLVVERRCALVLLVIVQHLAFTRSGPRLPRLNPLGDCAFDLGEVFNSVAGKDNAGFLENFSRFPCLRVSHRNFAPGVVTNFHADVVFYPPR